MSPDESQAEILDRRLSQNTEIAWGNRRVAVVITSMDLFNRLLKTTPLTSPQSGLSVASAVLLLLRWEIGKLIAQRS